MTSEWNHWRFPNYEARTVTFRRLLQKRWKKKKFKSSNVKFKAVQDGQNTGQRISRHFPFFMYLWHAIKPACLDREIAPCLPTNKPPALLSGPPIYYSQSAVMSRSKRQHSHGQGYTRRPRTFQRGIGNPGVQTNNQKKTLSSLTAWILISELHRSGELEKVTVQSTIRLQRLQRTTKNTHGARKFSSATYLKANIKKLNYCDARSHYFGL